MDGRSHGAGVFAARSIFHRKPGYDPVELFWDREAGGVPLDPSLVRGSHGANAKDPQGVLLADPSIELGSEQLRDVDLHAIWMKRDRRRLKNLVARPPAAVEVSANVYHGNGASNAPRCIQS